jgi:hypothetical protein
VVRRANYYKILPIYIDNEQYTLQKLLWLVVKTVPGHVLPPPRSGTHSRNTISSSSASRRSR